jgi:anti-sigma factor RsiW
MDCERCVEDLTAYLDGELRDSVAKELRLHVEGCPPCAEELSELERSKAFFDSGNRTLDVSPEIWDRVRASIGSMEPPEPSAGLLSFLILSRWRLPVAGATAAAAVFGAWMMVRHQGERSELNQYMSSYIAARESGQVRLTLPYAAPVKGTVVGFTSASSSSGSTYSDVGDNPFGVKFDSDTNPFQAENR